VSERIAHVITTAVSRHADFLIDLHSSGSHIAMPLLVGYYRADNAAGRSSREAALRFGAPIAWGHEGGGQGRSLSGPHARGIPWLYTECPSGGWLHADVAALYARGVLNVMRHLDMLPGEALVTPVERELFGEGDVDKSLAAPASGFLVPKVELLDAVEMGDLLGHVATGREGALTGAGDDDRRHRVIGIQSRHGDFELVSQLRIERIQLLGAVQRDDRHALAPLHHDRRGGHAQTITRFARKSAISSAL
jgi:predicted deacylase